MSSSSEILRHRVHEIMPDLQIELLEINDDGLVNDVVIVNEEYVFRFAKKKEWAKTLHVETRIVDLIRSDVGVKVPAPIYKGEDYVVYPYLDGEPLLLETIAALDESNQIRIAEDLGAFLFQLHTTDTSQVEEELPSTLAPVTRERWLEIYSRVRETVYPLLWKHQVHWAEHVFSRMLSDERFFEHKPALIHGDLRPYHILIDRQRCEITGVIDFGVAGIGDPASDFGTLINTCGESFVSKMISTYPNLEDFMPRARFYAQALELQWVWLGIETGEKFWFVAHLGCPRDIRT